MEAIVMTAGLVLLIGVGLALLAKSWPRSSTRVGYRLGSKGDPPREGLVPRERDDEGRWGW